MGIGTTAAIAIAAGAAVAAGTSGAVMSAKEANKAKNRAARAEKRVKRIEGNRQAIINPYSGVKDLSGMAKDVSGMVSNPYANLSVATGAAEMQAEEADIALANTLDTLRSTGGSAGGATALAQAALQSKKGIAANIEQQEVNNEKLRAQGEATLEGIKMGEAQRIQMINMSEGQRLQSADAQGKAYQFEAKEQRDASDLARYSKKEANARAERAASKRAMMGSITGGLMGVSSAFSGAGSDRRLKKNIKLISYSPSGLKIYAFEYINKDFGEGVWQGVMSDEIPQLAVIKHPDGYDRVDYSQLDVEFKQI